MQTIISPANIHIDKGNQIYQGVFDQSLDFRIQMNYDTAIQFIRRIGGYNEFDPEIVITALECVDRMIPRKFYNEGNPNNGERRYHISVGREGSPVIYLDLYEWDGERLQDATMKCIRDEMEVTGLADEADYWREGSKVSFRFWWD